MVIQRIQSIFLLVAAVLMTLLCFVVPVGRIPADEGSISIYISALLPLLILNLLTALLLFIAIFLFKKLDLQIKVTKISIVLIVISAIIEAFVLYSQMSTDIQTLWVGSAVMLGCAFISSVLALRSINSDKKLLNSYNRLR